MKRCGRCKQYKDNSEFNSKGLTCKICHSARMKKYNLANPDVRIKYTLKKLYGLELLDYKDMVGAQEGRCFICQKPPKNGRRLSVDHCHKTGRLRKLLCTRCNVLVGQLENHPEVIEAAQSYLQGNTRS